MFEHVVEGCQCNGKRCFKCGEVKCHSDFYTDKRAKDGIISTCRKCVNERRRQIRQANLEASRAYHRAYRLAHADKLNAANRERYRANPEERAKKSAYYYANAERIKALRREYQQTHSQRIKVYKKARYQALAEQFKEQKRQYYQGNVEIIKLRKLRYREANLELYLSADKAKFARRRARKIQAGGKFSALEWLELKTKYNFTCLCCGRNEPDIRLTADHVIPLAKGGTNNIDNIQPLCISCNSKKHAKFIDYRDRTGDLSDG